MDNKKNNNKKEDGDGDLSVPQHNLRYKFDIREYVSQIKQLTMSTDSDTTQIYEALHNTVDKLIWDMIDHLREYSDEFALDIQTAQYASARAAGILGKRKESVEYRLGMLEGAVLVCSKIYEEKQEQDRVEILLAKHRKWVNPILGYLYKNDNGWGIQHTALAEAVGLSSSNLSNHMGYIVEAGVVNVTRLGKNRMYSLSHIGKKYIQTLLKEQDKKDAVDWDGYEKKKMCTDEVQGESLCLSKTTASRGR